MTDHDHDHDHDQITPARGGELIAGAAPRDDAEREFLAMLSAVRSSEDGPPERLRMAVAELAAAPSSPRRPSVSRWVGSLRRRLAPAPSLRLARVLPVAAVLALAAAVAIPALVADRDRADDRAAVAEFNAGASGSPALAPEAAPADRVSEPPPAPSSADGAAVPGAVLPADPTRRRQVSTWTRVQVADVEALSAASTEAMRSVRALGGFTADSEYRVPTATSGTHRLVFRVPVSRAGEAVETFGTLGTVTGQEAELVDVTARVAAADRAIGVLERSVDQLRGRVRAAPGDASLRAQLRRAERRLATERGRRAATVERARLATVRLLLTTEGPAAAPADQGRSAAALSRSLQRLDAGLAWTLGALVLTSPLIALSLLGAWIAGRLRRRANARIMAT